MDDEEQVDAVEAETEVPEVEAVEEEVAVPAEKAPERKSRKKKAADKEPEEEPVELQVVDAFANGAIPAGATGPSVDRLRAQLGMPGSGPLDRRVSNAVRSWQASNGFTPTGRVDAVTRRAMGV